MSINIKSGSSIKEVNVTTLSAITINLPTNYKQSGFLLQALEADDGSILGSSTRKNIYITQDYRINKNLETTIWNDIFSHTTLNNTKYIGNCINHNIVLSGGSLNLNGDSNTITGSSMIRTFRYFPLYLNAPIYTNFRAKFSTTLQNNNVIEFGLGIVSGLTNVSDGVFFRTSAGTLNTVVSYSGYETTQINVFTPSANTTYDFLIALNDTGVEFWINDIIVSKIIQSGYSVLFTSSTVTLLTATGVTTSSMSLPLFVRNRNTNVVATPIQFNLFRTNVLLGDFKSNKKWDSIMIGNGQSSISEQNGNYSATTGTSTANLINSQSPSIASLSNTIAAYNTLGGQFLFPATGNTETDYLLFSYYVPSGDTLTQTKTLIIRNIYIDTYTSGATINTGTGTTIQWSLGVGSTDMALTSNDSVTNGTRGYRVTGIGSQTFSTSAVTGTMANKIRYEPLTPIQVESGTYFSIIIKIPIGVATPSLHFRGLVNINGYFE